MYLCYLSAIIFFSHVDASVDEEILLGFTGEDLKDLFPGVEKFLLRSKIWNIIEKLVCILK